MSASAASSGAGAGEKLSEAMNQLGEAVSGTVLLATRTLNETVKVADKTVEVTGKTAIDAVETAGVVAEAALGVTRKAATSAQEITEITLDTTVKVVNSAGRITSTTATTAANVVNSAGRITSTTTKAAANITDTVARYTTKTANTAANVAIKAQEDAQAIASSAGDLAVAATNAASKLGQAASRASEKTGTAALNAGAEVSVAAIEASKETTVKGLDLVKTTLATSADLTKDLANNTIRGVHNMVNIISSAGARYAEKVKIQQNAAKKTQEALGLTNAIKDQLRAELRVFSGEFVKSLVAFKATQLESLTVLHAILRNEYCLGRMSGFTRIFTKRCPPKVNSESISKKLKIYMDQNDARSKNIMSKVNSIVRAFEVNHINLINFSKSDPEIIINTFKARMDEMMSVLAGYTEEIRVIYQKTIDWVQNMIDKRMNNVLAAYNAPSANNKGSVIPTENVIGNRHPPMVAIGGKRRTSRSRVAKKHKHRTIRRGRN